MDKDLILCLVGESGSGKTTVSRVLSEMGYNIIQSYTTREPREENEFGHIFVTEQEVPKLDNGEVDKSDMFAYTFFHNNHYWAQYEQYRGRGVTIYVIDPDGVIELLEKVRDARIEVVYLSVDEETRKQRMAQDRGESFAIERIEHDREKFKALKDIIHWKINNDGTVAESVTALNYPISQFVKN